MNEDLDSVIADFLIGVESSGDFDLQKLCDEHPEFESDIRQFFDLQNELFEDKVDRSLAFPLENPAQLARSESAFKRMLGRYIVLEKVGHGGFGVVFRALDPVIGREVAIKIPRSGDFCSIDSRKQMAEETAILASLNHPSIVTVFHAEELSGYFCMITEFVPGMNLQQILDQRQTFSIEQVVSLTISVCDALSHAHEAGVVHLDVKPSNILLPETKDCSAVEAELTKVKLTDFGLSKIVREETLSSGSLNPTGTLPYMAPERIHFKQSTGPATDVYSVGVVMFRLLAGQMPYEADTEFGMLHQILEVPARELRHVASHIPAALSAVISKCLSKDVDERYETASQLGQDLISFKAGRPVKAQVPNRIDYARSWVRRKERVREAADYTIALNLLMLFWAVGLTPLFSVLGLLQKLDANLAGLWLTGAAITLGIHLPMIFAARQMRKMNMKAAYVTLFIAVVTFGFCGLSMFNVFGIEFGGVYRNQDARLLVFSLLLALLAWQVVANAFSVYAIRYACKSTR